MEAFDVIDELDDGPVSTAAIVVPASPPPVAAKRGAARQIGVTKITQANIDHSHIYLRSFFEAFPDDLIGGSNKATAAKQMISVNWGGATPVSTDLDGKKKFFRSRGWIRTFFERNGAVAGDQVAIYETGSYTYRVTLLPR